MDLSSHMDNVVAYLRANPRNSRWDRQPKRPASPARGCYICGGSHIWKYCPGKRCPGCRERGHTLNECLKRSGPKGGRKILNLEHWGTSTELSVVLPVKLNGKSITAILDSGAGPSVIDYNTIFDLGLKSLVRDRLSLVYALARKPVTVVGDVNLTLDLGGGQIVTHTFEVLRRFHSTELVWGTHKVRLGNIWKESQDAV